MGAANSAIATAENIALLEANTNVSSQESCNNNQVIDAGEISVSIGQVNCGIFELGNITATSQAVCNQYQEIAVLSKVMADQLAAAEAATGLGLFENAQANASSFVQVQNNIATLLAASCTNSQKVSLGKRSFTAGVLSGESCKIFNGAFSQEAACIQTLKADISNVTEVSQTTTAKATAGLDLGQLILFLLLLFGGGALLAILGAIIKAIITGGGRAASAAESSGLFGSGGASISELVSKRNALQAVLKQREAASANIASFVRNVKMPVS
jgi:hypothetical protein